ncbi:MAG: GDP-mannose 4,6-dehydratase [Rhodothermaceae bacterium]|nr:GDP-mannose 4,6-dehydratase [Rhodothermaceae bacterium]
MKIAVTGGAGFIGSHISDALIAQGHEVHIIDDLSGGFRHNLNPKAVFHHSDIRAESIPTLFEKERFEVLYHLAAQMDVRKSVADPQFDAKVNVLGFLNLLEAGRKNGLTKVILSSTGGAIYGEPDYTPQDENHTERPMSPYGITKLVSEHYLRFYNLVYDLKWISLRYANVYGPRQNAHGEAGVVAIFTERMLRGQNCFINGDGLQTRDYVNVADVVQANLLALKHPSNGIFNVGTGVETNVVELFRYLKKFTGSDMPETHADGKPGEQMRSVVGTAKIEKEMGWKRKYTIEEGLRETVEWFKAKEKQNV